MNKFIDTSTGKSLKVLFWIFVAYAITFISTNLANYHWPISLVQAGVPGIVNWLLYTVLTFADKEVPNLPSSQKMQLVPVNQTEPDETPTTTTNATYSVDIPTDKPSSL